MSKFSEGFLKAPLLSDILIEFFHGLAKKRRVFVEADKRLVEADKRLEKARDTVRTRNYGYF